MLLWSGIKAVWNSFNRLFGAIGQATGGVMVAPGTMAVGAAAAGAAVATGGAALAANVGSSALAGLSAEDEARLKQVLMLILQNLARDEAEAEARGQRVPPTRGWSD